MARTKNPPKKEPALASLSPLAICACNNLRKASRAVTQYFDDRLQTVGLRSTQLVILLVVMENEEAGIAQLARILGMDASTLNRNLRPLTDRRLIKIADGQSGQRKTVTLTDAGRKLIAEAAPIWKVAQDQIMERFGESRYSGLLADLSALIDATRD